MLNWFTLILLCQLAGELLVTGLGLPLPGPVAGMVALFAILTIVGKVPEKLSRISDALLSNLSLLFVPAGVGIMTHFALLKEDWAALGTALIVSTLATIAVTALAMIGLKRLTAAKNKEPGGGD